MVSFGRCRSLLVVLIRLVMLTCGDLVRVSVLSLLLVLVLWLCMCIGRRLRIGTLSS